MLDYRKCLAGIAGAAVALSVAGAASAATISFSRNLGELPVGTLPDTISIRKFDLSLGALTAAQLTLSMTAAASINARNIGLFGQPYRLGSVSATTTVGVALASPSLAISSAAHAAAEGPPVTLTPGELWTPTGLSNTPAPAVLALNGEQILAFTGVGQNWIDLILTKSTTVSGTSDGGADMGFASGATITATLEVFYTYTPTLSTEVPEPASLAILAAPALGIAAQRRRRKIH